MCVCVTGRNWLPPSRQLCLCVFVGVRVQVSVCTRLTCTTPAKPCVCMNACVCVSVRVLFARDFDIFPPKSCGTEVLGAGADWANGRYVATRVWRESVQYTKHQPLLRLYKTLVGRTSTWVIGVWHDYLYICIYSDIGIRIYVFIYVYTYIYMYDIYIHVFAYTYKTLGGRTSTWVMGVWHDYLYIYIYVYIAIYVYMYIYICMIYTYMYSHIHTKLLVDALLRG